MILVVNEHAYEMAEDDVRRLLGMAKSYVRKGIYAIEDEGYIELHNDEYDDDDKLRQDIIRYRMKGLRVHCNL